MHHNCPLKRLQTISIPSPSPRANFSDNPCHDPTTPYGSLVAGSPPMEQIATVNICYKFTTRPTVSIPQHVYQSSKFWSVCPVAKGKVWHFILQAPPAPVSAPVLSRESICQCHVVVSLGWKFCAKLITDVCQHPGNSLRCWLNFEWLDGEKRHGQTCTVYNKKNIMTLYSTRNQFKAALLHFK